MISARQVAKIRNAMPFWMSLGLLPMVVLAAIYGGWALILPIAATWYLFSVLDALTGLNLENADPETPEEKLFWYRAITLIWAPLQFIAIFGTLIYITQSGHLTGIEEWALFAVMGVASGTIGINYSHELMHQSNRQERWLGDILLGMVLYGHFRSEHLLVHHSYVGTPRDPVTARYNEAFHRFFPRVLIGCLRSSFRAEKARLARKGLPWWDRSNPFWRYWALELGFAVLALSIGGVWGLFLFATQAFWAVFQLELVNYVEHYGLTRKHLGEGKYEHTQPRHSWNAAHKASNWLLINLQRHSDHHYKPNRRFPLLQNYSQAEAPQLPYGYPAMTMLALVPPLWRKRMNPRVQAWREMYYPEITEWQAYNKGQNPMPR